MGRQKGDGRGRIGGRLKGKPNKLTSELREVLGSVLSREITPRILNSLLRSLEPAQRLNAMAKLLEFTIPKLQSISVEQQVAAEYAEIERLLKEMPESAVDELFERIKKLKNEQNTEN